jgi:hypothetical protein
MTPSQGTPLAPGLETLIEKARADLAQRLAISASDIAVLEATGVTWPDSSLGCPQEGMAYMQVLTPGYLIRLSAGGQAYEYHASRRSEAVYCQNPMPPVEGTPVDV